MTEVEQIANEMNKVERAVCIALCGNSWTGDGNLSPGLAAMNRLGLIHIQALKNQDGTMRRYKAGTTALGLAVRAHLERQNNDRG